MLSGFKALIRISMPTHRQTIVSKILLPLLMIKKIIIITIKTVMQRAISCGCAVSRLPMDVGFRQLRLETLDHSVVYQYTSSRPLSGIPENCIYLIQHHILYSSKTSLNILEYIHSELENVKSFTRTNINKPEKSA